MLRGRCARAGAKAASAIHPNQSYWTFLVNE